MLFWFFLKKQICELLGATDNSLRRTGEVLENHQSTSEKPKAIKQNDEIVLEKENTHTQENNRVLKNQNAIIENGKRLSQDPIPNSQSPTTNTQIPKLLSQHFASDTEIEQNTFAYQKLRSDWQKARQEGGLKDLSEIESQAMDLQKKMGLKVKAIQVLLIAFLEQRKEKGKPINAYTIQNLLNDLDKYSESTITNAKAILEKSLIGGWAWIYPPSDRTKTNTNGMSNQKMITEDYQRYCSNPRMYAYQPPKQY